MTDFQLKGQLAMIGQRLDNLDELVGRCQRMDRRLEALDVVLESTVDAQVVYGHQLDRLLEAVRCIEAHFSKVVPNG